MSTTLPSPESQTSFGAIPVPNRHIPECSRWGIWIGHEVEGSEDRGIETLFIRYCPDETQGLISAIHVCNKEWRAPLPKRVWFCDEFFHQRTFFQIRSNLIKAAEIFEKICVTLHLPPTNYEAMETVNAIAHEFPPHRFRIYWRVPYTFQSKLRKDDFICFGPPFNDEAFQIGQGTKVYSESYAKDKRLY